jgi:hypothetical protein
MRSLRQISVCAAGLLFFAASAARAQQAPPDEPIPAYQPPLGGVVDTDTDAGQTPYQTQVVNQSLSGVQNLTLGLESTRSYWQPHLDIFGSADSNAQEIGPGPSWTTWTTGTAGVDIHRVTGISSLTMSVTSGGMYSNVNTVNSGVTEGLNFAEKLTFRRMTLSLYDQASYLPESSFGFGGTGGAGLPAGGQNAPGLAFNPGQVLLTGRGQTVTNAGAGEVDEELTRRSSLSFSGGYSLLHYFGGDLFDYRVANARGGYNYKLSDRDTIAVVYTFGDYHYANVDQPIIDHTAQFTYGRVINGELAMQIAAGPQIVFAPTVRGLNGGGGEGTEPSTAATMTQVLWALNSSLQFQQRRYGASVTYNHGANGGSGVLIGAETDVVTGSVTRQMSRTFSSGFTGGYSRSHGLPGTGATANELYDYWFGGINLTEPLGQAIGLTVSYQVQYQTSNAVACVGPTCGMNVLRHLISVGLGWHERPLLF